MPDDPLVNVITANRDRISEKWAKAIHGSSSNYASLPVEELRRNTDELLEGVLLAAGAGDYSRLFDFIDGITRQKSLKGFKLGEVQRVATLGTEVILEELRGEPGACDCTEGCWTAMMKLLGIMSWAITSLGDVFSDAKEKEFSAATIIALTAAQQSPDEKEIIDRTLQECCRMLGFEHGAIMMRHHGRFAAEFPEKASGYDHSSMKRVGTKVIVTGRTAVMNADDEAGGGIRPRVRVLRSVTGVPMMTRGRVIGALVLGSASERAVTPHELSMIQALATQLSLAWENARLSSEAKERNERLGTEQKEVLAILNDLGAIVYVADMDTYEVLAVNRTTEDSFGKNLVGRKCYEVLQNGMSGPCPWCTNKYLVKDGVPTGPYSWQFQNTVNGRTYQCNDRAIRWPDGRLARLEVAFDITELERSRKKLDDTRRMLELFNDLLVHDIGGYAGTARAYVELASEHLVKDEERKLVETSMDQLVKIDRLIGRVSRAVKAQSKGGEDMSRQDLASVLDEAVHDVEAEQNSGGRPVERKYEKGVHFADLGEFAGDIFYNLASNAVKYGTGRPVTVEVVESALRGRPAWKVSVTDRGNGIPPEKKDKLFTRFGRLESLSELKGMGLGLVLVRTLTEMYGGEVTVEDRVKGDHTQGTVFSVRFQKAKKP